MMILYYILHTVATLTYEAVLPSKPVVCAFSDGDDDPDDGVELLGVDVGVDGFVEREDRVDGGGL